MEGFIGNIDFINIDAEKYWTFPTSYKGNKQEEIEHMLHDGNYVGAEKKDGMYGRFIKDDEGNCFLISRNQNVDGTMTNKIDHVPQLQKFFNKLPKGTCLLGEIYFPNNPGSRKVTTIMGCLTEKAIERQEKGEKLHYYIFDIWATCGKSMLKTPIEERIQELQYCQNHWYDKEYVEYAKYYRGEELEDELARVRSEGGEGVVITKIGSKPEPGKRTARKTLKIKTELDSPVDCFLTGNWKEATRSYNGKYVEDWPYWQNIRTGELLEGFYWKDFYEGGAIEPVSKAYFNGWASAIELGMVDKDEKIVSVGWISGITEDVKMGIVKNPEKWRGQVVMVNAMSIEPDTKKFRHGRIVQWRNDKSWKDCNLSQLFNE